MQKVKRVFKKRGLTLVELLVVVALMVALAVAIVPNLLSRNIQKEFDATVENIFYSLNQARERAVAWEKGTTWGVFFCQGGDICSALPNCSSQPRLGVFYTNSGYDESDKVVYLSALPKGIDYATSTWGSCYRIIDFKEITGERWDAGGLLVATSSVKIFIVKKPNVSSTILVSPLGVATYTTSSAQ